MLKLNLSLTALLKGNPHCCSLQLCSCLFAQKKIATKSSFHGKEQRINSFHDFSFQHY